MANDNESKWHTELANQLTGLVAEWRRSGLPSKGVLETEATRLESWKKEEDVPGLWPLSPPVMVTATIDDGMGIGLQIIHQWANVMGMRVSFLGLLKSAEEIIDACQRLCPQILGMTVLQFDTESDLIHICRNLPPATRFVAGGPVFKGDSELAGRIGVHFVAPNLSHFVKYILDNYRF